MVIKALSHISGYQSFVSHQWLSKLCLTSVVILMDSFHQVLYIRMFRIVVSPFFESYLRCHYIASPDSRNRNLILDSLVPLQLLSQINWIDSFHQVLHIRMFRIGVSPFFVSYLGRQIVSSIAIYFLCVLNRMPFQNLRHWCKEVRSFLNTVTWRYVGEIVVQ